MQPKPTPNYVLLASSPSRIVVKRFGMRTSWIRTKYGIRVATNCAVCGVFMNKWTLAFKPIGNPLWRKERICLACGGQNDGHRKDDREPV